MGANARRRFALAVKRAIDVGGASTAALILSPVLAWFTLAVAATDGLPFLFRQERGLNGEPFVIVKFRTIRRLAEARCGT